VDISDVAWNETGLTTQANKNRIYVQPSAHEEWAQFLESTPRDPLGCLQIHAILVGSYLNDPSNLDNKRVWPDEDGINVLGTSLGTPDFIDSYLFRQGRQASPIVVIHLGGSLGWTSEGGYCHAHRGGLPASHPSPKVNGKE
jgi:hypothetical protein